MEQLIREKIKYFYNKANFTEMRNELRDMDWEKLLLGNSDVDETWEIFTKKLNVMEDMFHT